MAGTKLKQDTVIGALFMAVDLDKWQSLKSKVESLNKQAERAAGALQQLEAQLESNFDCDSEQQGEKLIADLLKKEGKLTKEYESAFAEFEQEHGDKLKDVK